MYCSLHTTIGILKWPHFCICWFSLLSVWLHCLVPYTQFPLILSKPTCSKLGTKWLKHVHNPLETARVPSHSRSPSWFHYSNRRNIQGSHTYSVEVNDGDNQTDSTLTASHTVVTEQPCNLSKPTLTNHLT